MITAIDAEKSLDLSQHLFLKLKKIELKMK